MFDVFPRACNQLLAPSGPGVGAFEMNNSRLFLAWDHLLIFRVALSQEMEAESIELSDADVSGASQRNERRNMNGSLGDGRPASTHSRQPAPGCSRHTFHNSIANISPQTATITLLTCSARRVSCLEQTALDRLRVRARQTKPSRMTS